MFARNDDFIEGLIDKFGLAGYYYWFALIEICAEQSSDEMREYCKFHESRLYRELKCNSRRLRPVLDYMQTSRKLVYNHTDKYYEIAIVKLPDFMGKYSDKKEPNTSKKRKEKKRKENTVESVTLKENKIPYTEIIDYLNQKTEKNFKASSAKTISLIEARIKDGFSLEDFKTVINNKVFEWLGDDRNNKYLRPETLFGNKFDGYLNEKKKLSEEELLERLGGA